MDSQPVAIAVVHRWKQASILATAFRREVPITVHPGIGYDIIAKHPMFNGAAIGRAAQRDFAQFAAAVEALDGGVVLSVGSAIMGPQVFEKSLSCVNNLRLQDGATDRQGPRYLCRRSPGRRRLGLDCRRAAQDQSGLLSAVLQELRPHGRANAVSPVRQSGLHAPFASSVGMTSDRLREITDRYAGLRIAVLGDFCLDRYLEIDPARGETSIETGLPVYNVTRVRAQPGGAGTVLNNLVALGVGHIVPLGFAGEDGEGFELTRALQSLPGVRMESFLTTPLRRTFTYCKPLVVEPDNPPRELNRLDSKNWTSTPKAVEDHFIAAVGHHAERVDALIIMDQVDVADTGVLTRRVLDAVGEIADRSPRLRILADSRRSLRGYPAVCLKMNRDELGVLLGGTPSVDIEQTKQAAAELARRHGRDVFVTLAADGLLGATPDGQQVHFSALPIRGAIDIVGAGDAVTANLTAALASGASVAEALELANTAASIVIHQLGTTGSSLGAATCGRVGTTVPRMMSRYAANQETESSAPSFTIWPPVCSPGTKSPPLTRPRRSIAASGATGGNAPCRSAAPGPRPSAARR